MSSSLVASVTVCSASGSSFIALVRVSSSTLFSVNQSSPPSVTSARDFSPPRKPLETAVRSYGGSGSRETITHRALGAFFAQRLRGGEAGVAAADDQEVDLTHL